MRICNHHRFGPVQAVELGYSPIGKPLMTVFLYMVDGVLVDTGQPHMRREVLDIMASWRPDRVVLTHHHEDHSGNARAIGNRLGTEVLGHPLAAQKMVGPQHILPYQHLVWGKADPVLVRSIEGEIPTRSGRLMSLHTPGHSKDHVVYLDPENGWLFSGDLYIGERIKYFRVDEKMSDQIDSLEKILMLDFDVLFCGHHPVGRDGKKRIHNKLSFLQEFQGTVRRLRQEGLPISEIIRRLDRHQDRLVKWVTLGNVCFGNMVRSAWKD
jgi:glyoxylase-like metal-dependent hydrolase (beta-lactamase superfamily II)